MLIICPFLLSEAVDGVKPEEMVNDLVAFLPRCSRRQGVFGVGQENVPALVSLLTPKPERQRAIKVSPLARTAAYRRFIPHGVRRSPGV